MDTVIAINAANEGIPVAAIARITRTPFDEVIECLKAAKARGEVIDMPRPDWPPGVKLHDRLPSLPLPNDSDLQFLCGKAFKLTQLEAGFLVALLKNRQVEKTRLHGIVEHQRQQRSPNDHEATDPKMVDVMICKLRKKMKTVDDALVIETIWGSGYYVAADMKPKILAHLDGDCHEKETALTNGDPTATVH
jgi:DNA-binding winged helix-turn-helix (wHTH) protein